MRMSVPAYFCLIFFGSLIIASYALNPDPAMLRMALPMFMTLAVIPILLNIMNRRQADRIDLQDYKLYKIKDLSKLNAGAPVRLRGTVEALSLQWLNRGHYKINDGSGNVGVMFFAAPREKIKIGDNVEAAGSLRAFGLKKDKKVWCVKIKKIQV